MSITDLTFAAEHLGKAEAKTAVPILLYLLDHTSPLVREGAVYGASHHAKHPALNAKLHRMESADPNRHIRVAARESLEDADA